MNTHHIISLQTLGRVLRIWKNGFYEYYLNSDIIVSSHLENICVIHFYISLLTYLPLPKLLNYSGKNRYYKFLLLRQAFVFHLLCRENQSWLSWFLREACSFAHSVVTLLSSGSTRCHCLNLVLYPALAGHLICNQLYLEAQLINRKFDHTFN